MRPSLRACALVLGWRAAGSPNIAAYAQFLSSAGGAGNSDTYSSAGYGSGDPFASLYGGGSAGNDPLSSLLGGSSAFGSYGNSPPP